ncbi:MAG: DUF2934 domain-containing protein [Pseudomonadota bacterium]
MGIVSIPVRLSLSEGSAVALMEAADDLAAADCAEKFVAALDTNRMLWLTLASVAERHHWPIPTPRTTDFVMTTTRFAGRGIKDEHVEVLIGINREVSRELADGHDLDPIRSRALLAWHESGEQVGLPLGRWLIAEIDRKARLTF